MCLCHLYGEYNWEGWKAPIQWFYSFAVAAKYNTFVHVCVWGSKMKPWHWVIETIPYTSGGKKNNNLVTLTIEKEIILFYVKELQESKSGVILHLQKHLAFSWID